MRRRTGRQAIRRHRSYTVEETARCLGLHKNTVRNWVKSGALPALTEARPHLLLGLDLQDYLRKRKEAARTRLRLGQMYCLGCKAARFPAEGMVEDIGGAGALNLRGICPEIGRASCRERV